MKIYLAGEFGGGKQREVIALEMNLQRLYSFFYRDAGLDFILTKLRSNHDSRTTSSKIQTKETRRF